MRPALTWTAPTGKSNWARARRSVAVMGSEVLWDSRAGGEGARLRIRGRPERQRPGGTFGGEIGPPASHRSAKSRAADAATWSSSQYRPRPARTAGHASESQK